MLIIRSLPFIFLMPLLASIPSQAQKKAVTAKKPAGKSLEIQATLSDH
jgi:hypothetical protein